MRCSKLIMIPLTVLFAFPSFAARQEEDFESGAIKTDYGYLLVWNAPNNHYTLEIKGKNARQISTERIRFNVDGMFLEILTAPTKDVVDDSKRQKLDDRALLEAHRDWEAKSMESDYKTPLKLESSWQKLSNGKDALTWQFTVPESAHTNVKKQIFLTLLKGDFVLMLGGIVTDEIAESASRQLLLETAQSLKASDKPIDLRKLQQEIRKEAASGSAAKVATSPAVDSSRTTALKGRVFRSDTNEPIANALIALQDKQDQSFETKTDAQGNYSIPNLAGGKYAVSIRAWYQTQEEAPCQLLMGKTADKGSVVMVIIDAERYVQRVLIEGFAIKAGKETVKDFDFVCRSAF